MKFDVHGESEACMSSAQGFLDDQCTLYASSEDASYLYGTVLPGTVLSYTEGTGYEYCLRVYRDPRDGTVQVQSMIRVIPVVLVLHR